MTYVLRGSLPSGGSVVHPLPESMGEPSVEDAKAYCARLVTLQEAEYPETVWSVEEQEARNHVPR